MRRLLPVLVYATLTASGYAQNAPVGPALADTLSFEVSHTGSAPLGWGGGPPGTIFVDGQIVHAGRWSARIERTPESPNAFSTFSRAIPLDFAGARIEWRGFLRTEGVTEFVGLWMRQDGDAPGLAFDNMQSQQIRGTRDWAEYTIALPVHAAARQLYVGVLLSGAGKVWVDDLQLLVDGKPVWEAPKVERPKTALELDRDFDAGSGVVISDLTPAQIQNLTTLGKVWGFLKYHHPAVVAGQRHWDYELFRVLPSVLAARDRDAGNAALLAWARGLGNTPPCTTCVVTKPQDPHLGPAIDWIDQEARLGRDLATLLRHVHRNRSGGKQFYVSQAPGVGNPVFERELAYAQLKFPDAGYQLLALYRFWNIIQYWFPYRDVIDRNWDDVLAEFIPRMARARDKDAYQLQTLALIATITDTHANLWGLPPQARLPAGACQVPVTFRYVQDRVVVDGYPDATAGPATGLRIGDVLERVDDEPVESLIARWAPYYPASNQPTRMRDIAYAMTRGPCTAARLSVSRPAGTAAVLAERRPLPNPQAAGRRPHDLPGETFRLLSDRVAYLKLSSVKGAEAAAYVERAQGTRGLVVDIRNYPSDFVVFALGSRFVDRPTPFARFTMPDTDNPGAFLWGEPVSLTPLLPRYAGRVIVLVDETSISQSEYTAMAFRSAPQALVVGSTTAGADGNVSPYILPGGLQTAISGIGVFYPDKKPTQRIGIVPDVEVRPTIAGIRAGRDEVLEEALRQILGPGTPAAEIETLARP